jgi:exodeoxyribonuclease VII small subunit
VSEDRQDQRGGTGASGSDTGAPVEGEAKLENRLRRLEEIVRALEADDLELDKALALFEEGVSHVRGAEKLLAEAELRVEELLGENGDLDTRPMDPEAE